MRDQIPLIVHGQKQFVLVRDIARIWYPNSVVKIPTTAVVKYLAKNGFNVVKLNISIDNGMGGKRLANCNVLEAADLDSVLSLRPADAIVNEPEITKQSATYFYIVQKYPNHAPAIIKMGMTSRTVAERIAEYNVYSPKVLIECPISPVNERTLIAMISAGNEQLGMEEFWVKDIDQMLERAKQVLSFLPTN